MSFASKLERTNALLRQAERDFAPAALSTSLGIEDQVLTDLIARHAPGIALFALDTGRLPAETYALIARTESRYKCRIDGEIVAAGAGQSVTLVLDRDIDVSRGDTIVAESTSARVAHRHSADLCWLDGEAFTPRRGYSLKHTSRTVPARLTHIESRLDIKTLTHQPGGDAVSNQTAGAGMIRAVEA